MLKRLLAVILFLIGTSAVSESAASTLYSHLAPAGIGSRLTDFFNAQLKAGWGPCGHHYKSENDQFVLCFYNRRTLRVTSPEIRQTWVKLYGWKGNLAPRNKRANTPAIKSSLSLDEFDCRDRKRRSIKFLGYDKRGSVALQDEMNENATWQNVVPDTLSEKIWTKVCSQELK